MKAVLLKIYLTSRSLPVNTQKLHNLTEWEAGLMNLKDNWRLIPSMEKAPKKICLITLET
jgi:hypothetical protein